MATEEYTYPEHHCTVRIHRPDLPPEERERRLKEILRVLWERHGDALEAAMPRDK